jgi:hypothetical protein
MSGPLLDREVRAGAARQGLRPVRFILVVLALLVLVSAAADWYSRQVSLPRYCDQPELALARLETLYAGNGPARHESRRDYMVAAKLEFLLPRAAGEAPRAYRQRVLRALEQQCGREEFLAKNPCLSC